MPTFHKHTQCVAHLSFDQQITVVKNQHSARGSVRFSKVFSEQKHKQYKEVADEPMADLANKSELSLHASIPTTVILPNSLAIDHAGVLPVKLLQPP